MERIRIDRRQTGSRVRRRVQAEREAAAAAPLQRGGGADLDVIDAGGAALARIDAVLDAVESGRPADPR